MMSMTGRQLLPWGGGFSKPLERCGVDDDRPFPGMSGRLLFHHPRAKLHIPVTIGAVASRGALCPPSPSYHRAFASTLLVATL